MTRKQAVFNVMFDRQWHTLQEISRRTGFPEASVSAQLREYRVDGYKILKRFDGTEWLEEGGHLCNYSYKLVRKYRRQ